jgi:acyl-CoA synthetase (AMP-forming)/AMP-acid ligase II
MHSAESFRHSFGEAGIIHNVNVLPQHHVGGLMPVLRSAASGGKTFFTDYRKLTSTEGIPFDPGEAALSLVPTQLQRILEQPEGGTALAKFGLILIGGQPAGQMPFPGSEAGSLLWIDRNRGHGHCA